MSERQHNQPPAVVAEGFRRVRQYGLDEVWNRLAAACRDAGGQKAWAERNRLSAAYVSQVANAQREAGESMLRLLGLRRLVRFADLQTAQPGAPAIPFACSFCGRDNREVSRLLVASGPKPAGICNECVADAAEQIASVTPTEGATP